MSTLGESEGPLHGFLDSGKRVIDTLLATAENRIELFAVELQEEKCRMVEVLLCVGAVAALALMALTMITLTVVFLFWETERLAALGVLSLLYLLGTTLAWRALGGRLRTHSPLAGTLSELRKDRACLNQNP